MRADSIRRFWDRRAREDAFHFVDNRIRYRDPEAEERFWAGGRRDLDGLLDALGMEVSPDERVVEIGCGIGRLTRPLAERAASVVAVDVSARMLELARRLNPELANVDWLLGDGASLAGIPAASADVCFSYVVFQHIPDPQVTLGYVREIGRVLRPGGTAALHVSNDSSVHRRDATLRDRVRVLVGRAPRGQSHPAWIGSAVDLDDVRAAAAEAGMQVDLVLGEGTQFCLVRARKSQDASSSR